MEFEHLQEPDAKEWEGLKLAVRARYAVVCKHLLRHGTIQRADVMRLGEVSMPQSSLDLRGIQERVPGLMTYDKTARCYRLVTVEGPS